MHYRFENSNGNQSSAMHKIGRVLCIRNIHRPVGNVDKSVGGCGICVSKIVGTDSYKQKRGNPNNKINHKKKAKNISSLHESSFPPRLFFMCRLILVKHSYSNN